MDSKKRKIEDGDSSASTEQPLRKYAREYSIFGTKPVDDVTKYIADFIAQYCHRENVEVIPCTGPNPVC
jgi:polynucleotide 5'-triphosphatase